MSELPESWAVPEAELKFHFVCSSGPGGQNVNKVATKAVLMWPVRETAVLPAPVLERFCHRFAKRITSQGLLVVSSQRFRDQPRNKAECLRKLREMVAEVWPAPVSRKKTKASRGSIERRLKAKQHRSERKSTRGRINPGAD